MVALVHCQFLLALLCTILTISAAADTLAQSQTIANDQILASSGNNFQLGFFSPGANPAKRFLGIWFTVSPATVVWLANCDRPLNGSSGVLAVSQEGVLVLTDGMSNDTIWSSNSSTAIGPVAQLLDSGNLVLRDKAGSVLWQSFDHPTNSFLSGMRIGKNLKTGVEWSLSSWRSTDDPSVGDYHYNMDTEGSPELHVWDRGRKKYRSGPWNGVRFSPVMTTYSDMFEFHFVATAKEVSYGFKSKPGSPLARVYLDETGVLRRMVWDKDAKTWSIFWSGPRDPCDSYAKCGAFSVCNANDAIVCSCLKGFHTTSSREWYMRNTSGGCRRNTALGCSNSDGFYVLQDAKLPDTHNSIVDKTASLEECRSRCLSNCSCTAYAVADIRGGGSGCIFWMDELIDVRFIDGGQDLYIKLAKYDLGSNKNSNAAKIIVPVLASILVLIAIFLVCSCKIRAKRRCKENAKRLVLGDFKTSDELAEARTLQFPFISFEDILVATNNFSASNMLGEGGFGKVYKGMLEGGNEVAIKRLGQGSRQGIEEFRNEVALIAKLQHRNLVRLLGCYIQGDEKLLVYEYLPNKSLDAFLFDGVRKSVIDWPTRFSIIKGVGRGLLYLHQDSRLKIIHRDLKASNILLDAEMSPKISDFGMARIFGGNQQQANTNRVVGTYGYMSPEYAMQGTFSVKSDVYSFGVLLLEIVSGLKISSPHLTEFPNLIAYAWSLWKEGKTKDLVDSSAMKSCTLDEALRCIHIGLLCVQDNPSARPLMSWVVFMLENGSIPIPDPKRPLYFSQRNHKAEQSEDHSIQNSVNSMTVTIVVGR